MAERGAVAGDGGEHLVAHAAEQLLPLVYAELRQLAPAFDFDANSQTATTRRGAPTVNTYLATSGTTALFTGYGLLYAWGISNPSTVARLTRRRQRRHLPLEGA